MDRFIAIGVSRGDAFFLNEVRKKLVDGDVNKLGFAQQFSRTTSAGSVDVIVCTHTDADHINGLLGYFEKCSLAK